MIIRPHCPRIVRLCPLPAQQILVEILIRIILLLVFVKLEYLTPFTRKIHPDEIWLYRNPQTPSYIPAVVLWPLGAATCFMTFLLFYIKYRNRCDFLQASLGVSLAIALNGIFTDVLKLLVGRPRPDFFWRCFPDGVMNTNMECSGKPEEVIDGRKSFPSGHSSYSFASLGFISLYLFGKLHVFNENGRGKAWRLCISLLPILIAMSVAVSRTCDYHHHWQDVLVGSILGMSMAYLCYRQHYPALNDNLCHLTYSEIHIKTGSMNRLKSSSDPLLCTYFA